MNIYPFLPNRSPTTPTQSNTITSYNNNSTWMENHSWCHDCWVVSQTVIHSEDKYMGQEHSQVDWMGMHSTHRTQIYLLCAMAAMVLVLLCFVVSLWFVFIKLTPDSLFVGFYSSNSWRHTRYVVVVPQSALIDVSPVDRQSQLKCNFN